jgi:hypothetical protein
MNIQSSVNVPAKSARSFAVSFAIATVMTVSFFSSVQLAEAATGHSEESAVPPVTDRYVLFSDSICTDSEPLPPPPGSYGMDPQTGVFIHPEATPESDDDQPFEGLLDYWDPKQYQKNMEVLAFYPYIVEPFHTWQNIVDFDGRRYLYQYVRRSLNIYDITDPLEVKLLLKKGAVWGAEGPADEEVNPYPEDDYFGAASIQWNEERGAYIMVQSFEIKRFGVLKHKRVEQDKIEKTRKPAHLKGFKVYEMRGPMPEDWTLLSERTSDYKHPDAPIGQQQGSGVRDIPEWSGGKYMFVAAAPDDSYALTEYANDLYSSGYQAWDMSDPSNPVFLDQLTVPGQTINDIDAFKANPRCGNRTSWFGSRMSLFIPKPVEQGGKYGYAAMGSLGFFVVDISDPTNMKVVSNLQFPPSVAGTEGDFIDISQVEKTGIVYFSGYPLNEDCYEPYKDVYMIDVKDPAAPKVVGTLPRPAAPEDASFTDFCQRKGSFGPKRSGYSTQPGTPVEGYIPFAFYNAGVQVFDVRDVENPKVAAYFVPKFDTENVVEWARGNLAHGIYVEYDRNIVWLFTNHGFYALSSPIFGEPDFKNISDRSVQAK